MMLLCIVFLSSWSVVLSFGWTRSSTSRYFQFKSSSSFPLRMISFDADSTRKDNNPKSALLKQIDGIESDLFVCPESLAPLKLVRRQFGFVDASYFRDDKTSREYPVCNGQYIDLTLPEENNQPLWTRSIDELVGEGFFQNPFISTVYERGYRDNFKSKSLTTTGNYNLTSSYQVLSITHMMIIIIILSQMQVFLA